MPEMVVIPSGSFKMGCVSGIDCNDNEKPVHEVKIDSFAMSKYEVTFEEYDAFADARDRGRVFQMIGWGRGRRPVINVVGGDAWPIRIGYQTRQGETYRLPTEAEWEYAARAGTRQSIAGETILVTTAPIVMDAVVVGYAETAPVGSFSANGWGLYDMHGNVREWVQDCWNDSYEGAPTDGSAWLFGDCCSMRVFRGGSWSNYPRFLRSARRAQEYRHDLG